MIDETSMMWLRLRQRRSSIQGQSRLGESASRRKTFAAAMQQFEEQMTAARVVTPATSPLNLYYGLAQAGLAVAAAYAPDPWSFSRHGLRFDTNANVFDDMTIRPEGKGAFQAVASVIGSPEIHGPTRIGSLRASLPDLGSGLPVKEGDPSALRVFPNSPPVIHSSLHPQGILAAFSKNWVTPQIGFTFYARASAPGASDDEAAEFLSHYPAVREWRRQFQVQPEDDSIPGFTKLQVSLEPPLQSGQEDLGADDWKGLLDEVTPQYRYRDERFLRPSVEGTGSPPPSPLMTWWLLLYSFSMLARYHPRSWMELLDLDRSASAASIQYALTLASTVIPHLVLNALDRSDLFLEKSAPPLLPWA